MLTFIIRTKVSAIDAAKKKGSSMVSLIKKYTKASQDGIDDDTRLNIDLGSF